MDHIGSVLENRRTGKDNHGTREKYAQFKVKQDAAIDILPPINRGIPKTHDLGFCFFPF